MVCCCSCAILLVSADQLIAPRSDDDRKIKVGRKLQARQFNPAVAIAVYMGGWCRLDLLMVRLAKTTILPHRILIWIRVLTTSSYHIIWSPLQLFSFFPYNSDRKAKKAVNPGSAKAEYDLAAELGLATKDQVICRQRYASCPYTAEEMMSALRQSHL